MLVIVGALQFSKHTNIKNDLYTFPVGIRSDNCNVQYKTIYCITWLYMSGQFYE